MALPWILGGLAVGAAAYLLNDDEKSSRSSDRDEEEREARRREREAKKERVKQEIEALKKSEKTRIEHKYNAQIKFSNDNSVHIDKEDKSLEIKLNTLEEEQKDLVHFINQLKTEQNETHK